MKGKNSFKGKLAVVCGLLLFNLLAFNFLAACATPPNRYETASSEETSRMRSVALPVHAPFKISEGAFGKTSHSIPGHWFNWDFEVPVGTPVYAADSGQVVQVWESGKGWGCDPKYAAEMNVVKVEHADGTVAQYGHVKARVQLGTRVKKGQLIAETALSGWMCAPQLHFGVYRSLSQGPGTEDPQSLPVRFDGIPDGLLREGFQLR